jgi:hypothetical protein
MATQVPTPPQVSPDGRWVWNGSQWVPNVQPAGPYALRPYESAHFRSTFVVVFLAVNGFALLLNMIIDISFIALGGNLNAAAEGTIVAVGLFSIVVLILYYGSWIPTIVLFCMWVHRIVRNMPWIGAPDSRWTPAGAVGRCFIPFLNFVHPYRSVVDVWRASDPSTLHAEKPIRKSRPITPLLAAWWGTYLGGRIVATFSNRLIGSSDPSTVVAGAFIDLVANLALAGGAGLAILVVRQVTARQDAKRDLIVSGRLV